MLVLTDWIDVLRRILATVYSSLVDPRIHSLPRVPSFLPWIGSTFSYVSSPQEFFARYRKQFGPVYKFLLAGRTFVIISSASSVASMYTADHSVLSAHIARDRVFRTVCGLTGDLSGLLSAAEKLFFPLIEKRLSRHHVDEHTKPFARALLSRAQRYVDQHSPVSLTRFLTEPVYFATNLCVFGPKYHCDSYDDFSTLDDCASHLFTGMPFWFWPCMRARQRLKDHIAHYLNTPMSDEDVHIGADLARLHREQKTPLDQAVGSLLALKWGMFTNTFGIVFWLFAHLLNNPAALSAVRAEIDAAIDKEFGDFPAFLADASPKSLDRPCFQLLTSAIVETMRLGGLISIMHTAEQDCHLRNGEQMIPLQKGEFVLADVRGVHVDDSVYPDGYKFLYDRFAHCEHHPGILPTQGKPWFAFGFGRNVCKGRWLAMYQIKVLAIIYLHLFDFIPVANPRTSIWQLPRPRRLCLNSLRPEKDIIVHLRSRRNME